MLFFEKERRDLSVVMTLLTKHSIEFQDLLLHFILRH
jgi:hypothetical protein